MSSLAEKSEYYEIRHKSNASEIFVVITQGTTIDDLVSAGAIAALAISGGIYKVCINDAHIKNFLSNSHMVRQIDNDDEPPYGIVPC